MYVCNYLQGARIIVVRMLLVQWSTARRWTRLQQQSHRETQKYMWTGNCFSHVHHTNHRRGPGGCGHEHSVLTYLLICLYLVSILTTRCDQKINRKTELWELHARFRSPPPLACAYYYCLLLLLLSLELRIYDWLLPPCLILVACLSVCYTSPPCPPSVTGEVARDVLHLLLPPPRQWLSCEATAGRCPMYNAQVARCTRTQQQWAGASSVHSWCLIIYNRI